MFGVQPFSFASSTGSLMSSGQTRTIDHPGINPILLMRKLGLESQGMCLRSYDW